MAMLGETRKLSAAPEASQNDIMASTVQARAAERRVSSLVPATNEAPLNNFVTPMLTDMYQITMAYAYWKANRHNEPSVFDLFFRKNPFEGEFTIFAGLDECLKYVQTFRFKEDDIIYLRKVMPTCDPAFFVWLGALDCSEVKIHSVAEGTVVFPRVPLMRVEGPLAICQLLETTLLNLTNYASLMTTNAARFRLAAGEGKTILEFGLRRAQGPDGAMSATRYGVMGGCDGTANVAGAQMFGLIPRGTHAHSLVSAYTSLDELPTRMLTTAPARAAGSTMAPAAIGAAAGSGSGSGAAAAAGGGVEASAGGVEVDFVGKVLTYRKMLAKSQALKDLGVETIEFMQASMGELAAFISYAQAFPHNFLALIDTYDTLSSGLNNFIVVALALKDCGYSPVGVRLDSGDLAYLSKKVREKFKAVDAALGTQWMAKCKIVASNDINEGVILSLNDQGHQIDVFGIGTNLVTCQAQPALGMVYKLVEIKGQPRIKLSQDPAKITIPGLKDAYRLLGAEGIPILDVIMRKGEPKPQPGKRILCRHPFDEKRRAWVTPAAVIPLLRLVWKGGKAHIDAKTRLIADPLSWQSVDQFVAGGPTSPMSSRASAHVPPTQGMIPLSGSEGSSSAAAAGEANGTAGAGAAHVQFGGGDDASVPDSRDGSSRAGGDGAASKASRTESVRASELPVGVSLRARFPSLDELKKFVCSQLDLIREDHLRPLNPTPYKVSVTPELFHYIHDLWMKEVPVPELH